MRRPSNLLTTTLTYDWEWAGHSEWSWGGERGEEQPYTHMRHCYSVPVPVHLYLLTWPPPAWDCCDTEFCLKWVQILETEVWTSYATWILGSYKAQTAKGERFCLWSTGGTAVLGGGSRTTGVCQSLALAVGILGNLVRNLDSMPPLNHCLVWCHSLCIFLHKE